MVLQCLINRYKTFYALSRPLHGHLTWYTISEGLIRLWKTIESFRGPYEAPWGLRPYKATFKALSKDFKALKKTPKCLFLVCFQVRGLPGGSGRPGGRRGQSNPKTFQSRRKTPPKLPKFLDTLWRRVPGTTRHEKLPNTLYRPFQVLLQVL